MKDILSLLTTNTRDRSNAEVNQLQAIFQNVSIFKSLVQNGQQETVRLITKNLIHQKYNQDAKIIQSHIPMNGLFILIKGVIGKFQQITDNPILQFVEPIKQRFTVLGTLNEQQKTSKYDYICLEKCDFAFISLKDFKLLRTIPEKFKQQRFVEFLEQITYFNKVDKSQLKNLYSNSTILKYSQQETVFNEGEEGGNIFIIYKGIFSVLKKNLQTTQNNNDEQQKILLLTTYDIFGQEDIFQKIDRQYSIKCDSQEGGELLQVPIEYFKLFVINNPIPKKVLITKIDLQLQALKQINNQNTNQLSESKIPNLPMIINTSNHQTYNTARGFNNRSRSVNNYFNNKTMQKNQQKKKKKPFFDYQNLPQCSSLNYPDPSHTTENTPPKQNPQQYHPKKKRATSMDHSNIDPQKLKQVKLKHKLHNNFLNLQKLQDKNENSQFYSNFRVHDPMQLQKPIKQQTIDNLIQNSSIKLMGNSLISTQQKTLQEDMVSPKTLLKLNSNTQQLYNKNYDLREQMLLKMANKHKEIPILQAIESPTKKKQSTPRVIFINTPQKQKYKAQYEQLEEVQKKKKEKESKIKEEMTPQKQREEAQRLFKEKQEKLLYQQEQEKKSKLEREQNESEEKKQKWLEFKEKLTIRDQQQKQQREQEQEQQEKQRQEEQQKLKKKDEIQRKRRQSVKQLVQDWKQSGGLIPSNSQQSISPQSNPSQLLIQEKVKEGKKNKSLKRAQTQKQKTKKPLLKQKKKMQKQTTLNPQKQSEIEQKFRQHSNSVIPENEEMEDSMSNTISQFPTTNNNNNSENKKKNNDNLEDSNLNNQDIEDDDQIIEESQNEDSQNQKNHDNLENQQEEEEDKEDKKQEEEEQNKKDSKEQLQQQQQQEQDQNSDLDIQSSEDDEGEAPQQQKQQQVDKENTDKKQEEEKDDNKQKEQESEKEESEPEEEQEESEKEEQLSESQLKELENEKQARIQEDKELAKQKEQWNIKQDYLLDIDPIDHKTLDLMDWNKDLPKEMFSWDEDQCFEQPKKLFHFANLRLYLIDYENQDYDSAYQYLLKQLENGKEFIYPVFQFFIGDCYLQDEKYLNGLKHLLKAYNYLERKSLLDKQNTKNNQKYDTLLLYLCQVFQKIGDLEKAQFYLNLMSKKNEEQENSIQKSLKKLEEIRLKKEKEEQERLQKIKEEEERKRKEEEEKRRKEEEERLKREEEERIRKQKEEEERKRKEEEERKRKEEEERIRKEKEAEEARKKEEERLYLLRYPKYTMSEDDKKLQEFPELPYDQTNFKQNNVLRWDYDIQENILKMDFEQCQNQIDNIKENQSQALIQQFMLLYQQEDYKKAIETIDNVKNYDEKYKRDIILYLKGDAYFQDGQTEKALENFKKCFDGLVSSQDILFYFPQDLRLLYTGMCVCYQRTGRRKMSNSYRYKLFPEIDPLLIAKKKKLREEREAKDKELTQNEPELETLTFTKTDFNATNVLKWKSDINEEVLAMDEDQCYNVPAEQQNQVMIRLFMIDYQNDDYDCTYEYIQKLQKSYPDYKKPLVHYLQGDSLMQEKKYDQALESLEKCMEIIEPDVKQYRKDELYQLYKALSILYQQKGNLYRSNLYRYIIHPEHKPLAEGDTGLDGLTFEKKDFNSLNIFNWKEGIDEEILEMDEDDCYGIPEEKQNMMYFRLYMIDYENEEFDCAFDYLTKIAFNDKTHKPAAVHYLIADSYFLDEQYDKAVQAFEKCYKHLQDSQEIDTADKQYLQILFTGLAVSYHKLEKLEEFHKYKNLIPS